MRRVATALAVGSLVLGMAACGGDDKATIKTKDGEVKIEGGEDGNGSFTFKDADGNEGSFGASSELPKDFPKSDVPLPKGEVTASLFGSEKGKKSWTITMDVGGKLSSVADDYTSKLEDAGFTVDEGFGGSGDGSDFTSFTAKGDTYDVHVIGSTDNKTKKSSLVVTVGPHDKSLDESSDSSSDGSSDSNG